MFSYIYSPAIKCQKEIPPTYTIKLVKKEEKKAHEAHKTFYNNGKNQRTVETGTSKTKNHYTLGSSES